MIPTDHIPHRVQYKRGVFYEVVWADLYEHCEDRYLYGMCWKEERLIMIHHKLSFKKAHETFLHEFLHGIEFEYDCYIPHDSIRVLEVALPKIASLNGWG